MKYLWLCLFFLILGCSNQPIHKPNLKHSVAEVTKENEPVFSAGYADLNGDGLDDVVVLLEGVNWCGSGGCSILIFKNIGAHYQFVSKSSVTNTPISVANSESHGWKDLIVWSRGKGFVLIKFDGDGYASNPSLEPRVSELTTLESSIILE